jgi:hypothetical protein
MDWIGNSPELNPIELVVDHQEELKNYPTIISLVKPHEAITRLCVKLSNELTKKLAIHAQKAEAVHR